MKYYHKLVRLSQSVSLLGMGGMAFHSFHGPEHWLCIGIAALVTLGGSVLSLLFSYRHRQSVPSCCQDETHDEVLHPVPE